MKITFIVFSLFLIGCSTALVKKNSFIPKPKDPIVNTQFQEFDVNLDGKISQKEFEKCEQPLNNKIYVYREPVIITLIICAVTLLSCIISGAFKK